MIRYICTVQTHSVRLTKEKRMKQFKAVVAYHARKRYGLPPYQVMKIQGARPAINGLYRVGMWLDEKAVENVGRFADLTVIIGERKTN